MKLGKPTVSGPELVFAVFCFMQGTMLRSGFIISITRNDSWAMAFTGLLCTLPLVAVYAVLLRRFPGKNLFEIDDAIFGPFLGKAVSVMYLFFFLSLCALNTRDLGNFVVSHMIPDTPFPAVLCLFLLACAYVIRKGIENLIRLAILFCVVAAGAVAVNSILIFKDVNIAFVKPFFQLPLMAYVQGTITSMAIPMGEIIVFTMIAFMLKDNKKAGKPLAIGLIFAATYLGTVILRDIATLGPLSGIAALPSFESVRYVNLAEILIRMESIYAVVLIILFLFKLSILLYVSVLGLSQLLGFKDYQRLTMVTTALVFFYAHMVFQSEMENNFWGATTAPFFSLTFEALLPVVSLLVLLLKDLFRPREVKS